MKLTDITKVHFIGIGGIGMSGLARLFLHEGKKVSGSDRSPSDITRALETEGVHFFESQVASNIGEDVDLVVYTEAMPKDHEELLRAKEAGIPTMSYFGALGQIANEYYLIAVAGSHGKTTTTAMLIDVFEEAGLDPSGIVGSLRAKTKSNYRAGKSKYFIVEACEYRRDFMSLEPDVLVITNIEHEHVDYYKDLGAVQEAFRELAMRVPEDGAVVVNFSAPNIAPVLQGVRAKLIDYGACFNPLRKLKVPGLHNQMNAAGAKAVADFVGIKEAVAEKGLEQFSGTWRRFEYKGMFHGAPVYDDYGHHPTEIKATLLGAKELYPHKNITLVFQSHTYSRTHTLFNDFVDALGIADTVILLPIYAAREENTSGVSHTKLRDALAEKGAVAYMEDTVEDAVDTIISLEQMDDVIITMGAGDMTTRIAEALV